ncbi:hypothetical protein [Streptomyces sp. JJ38]|uniref:hypothetical protein n=1 Tax=Streptomyces sp. JJ38 TaxID=2738128 RepID=UPI001C59D565|nr:hypothetical protein [Streptomyces sp. JJ38]MBW1595599.1 hypothetical protein [Streptomyces sp. JJ38]
MPTRQTCQTRLIDDADPPVCAAGSGSVPPSVSGVEDAARTGVLAGCLPTAAAAS